jgi:hypothetical protein
MGRLVSRGAVVVAMTLGVSLLVVLFVAQTHAAGKPRLRADRGASRTINSARRGARGGDLVPAVSQRPSSPCPAYPGRHRLVAVLLGNGHPKPRCTRVRADQQLLVINKTAPPHHSVPITVTWPPFGHRTLRQSHGTVFKRNFGSYLAPGVHPLGISPKRDGPAEIWLPK